MKKRIFIVVFLVSATVSFAQVDVKGIMVEGKVDTTRGTFKKLSYRTIVPKNAIAFNLGYGVPFITKGKIYPDFVHDKVGMGLLFGVDYKHHFFESRIVGGEEIKSPRMLGIGVGLGVTHISKPSYWDDYTETYRSIDKDGDTCNVTSYFKGINSKVGLTYLDIPLYLEIGRPSQVKISGYLNVGVKASILVGKKITGEGTCTTTGFYEQINGEIVNVTVSDVEELGYYTDRDLFANVTYDHLSKFILWGSLSGGVSIPFSSLEKNKVSSCILRLGARADYSILPIVKNENKHSPIKRSFSNHVFLLGFDVKLIYCF